MLASDHNLSIFATATAVTAQALYPANGTYCELPTKWLDQLIDHNYTNVGNFKQKYYMTTEFYTPGGPVPLSQGEESTLTECLVRAHSSCEPGLDIGVLSGEWTEQSCPFFVEVRRVESPRFALGSGRLGAHRSLEKVFPSRTLCIATISFDNLSPTP